MLKTLKIFILILCLPVFAQAAESLADSLRRLVPTLQGREKHFALARIAMSTNDVADWDATVANAATQHDTVSLCMSMTNRFICMVNCAQADSLSAEAEKTLSFMRRARQWKYYFDTYRTYIDYLFYQRRYDDAQTAATAMYDAASTEGLPQGMALALQVQGSMYFRLDLYDKATAALEEALRICPDYRDAENQTLVTASLICEWLCMTAIKTEDSVMLATYAERYADVMKQRQQKGLGDQAGHFTVTAAAFRAQALLSQGDARKAEQVLDEAQRVIRPGVPARAYEHYYEARARLYILQGRYKEALGTAELLLSAHTGYFPFYLDDMLRKADLLARMNRPDESRELYLDYMQAKDSVERVEIAMHMDKLNMQYQVDSLRAEKHVSAMRFVAALCGAALLLVLLLGYIIYSRKLRHKNHALYLQIREREKIEERVLDAMEVLPVDRLSKETQLFCRLSECMHDDRLFTRPNINREEIAILLGTNEKYLVTAIRNNTDDMTFHEYVTDLRLKYAVRLLAENPEMSVEQVSEEAGFNSRSTLFRAFKDRFGISPSDYRREAVKK